MFVSFPCISAKFFHFGSGHDLSGLFHFSGGIRNLLLSEIFSVRKIVDAYSMRGRQEICAIAGDIYTFWSSLLRKGVKIREGSSSLHGARGRSALRVPLPSHHHRHADWTWSSGPAGIGVLPVCLSIPDSLPRPGQHSLV